MSASRIIRQALCEPGKVVWYGPVKRAAVPAHGDVVEPPDSFVACASAMRERMRAE